MFYSAFLDLIVYWTCNETLLKVGAMERWKRSSIFQASQRSQKSMLQRANEQKKKKTICQIFHQKKNQNLLIKIEETADVFLNSANFVQHAFLTLAPPSGFALNLQALIKVSRVSWTSQLSYEIFTSPLEKKNDKTNSISPKRTFLTSLLGVKQFFNP